MQLQQAGQPDIRSISDIAIQEIKALDELESYASEIDSFINDPEVNASVYHQSGYLRSVLRNRTSIVDWRVVVARKKGAIVCVIPFFIETSRMPIRFGLFRLGNFKTKILRFFGEHVAAAKNFQSADIFNLVKLTLARPELHFDSVVLYALPANDPVFGEFKSSQDGGLTLGSSSDAAGLVHVINFPASWDDYLNSMSKKRRYNLKRTVRLLNDEFKDNVKLEKFESPDEVSRFTELLTSLYNKSWQGKTFGAVNRSTSATLENETALAQAGCLKCYVLFVEQNPAAFVRGYLHKGYYYFEEIGYDLAWSKHSVGTVLNYMLLEDLMTNSQPPSVLNFGYGDNVYKQVFGNHSYPASIAHLYRSGSRAAVILAANRASDKLYSCLRGMIVALKIDHIVRKFLKNRA